MITIAGQHALVTGGGSGIGAAVARSLKETGARVTIVGRNSDRLSGMAEQLGIEFQVADVTDSERLGAALAAATESQGAITILVNNAGMAQASAFLKTDRSTWDTTLAVNLTGVFNCTQQVLPSMLKAGHGRIINIASTAALKGYAYVAAYCAAKHGVVGLTRSLAIELARKNITVNAVCPGYTDTEIVADAIERIARETGRSKDDALAELVKSNPQGRLIQPQEVADVVTWLCSQNSLTGQSIPVSGGEVM